MKSTSSQPVVALVGRLQSSVMQPLERDYHLIRLWETDTHDALPADWRDRVEVVVTSATYGARADLMARLPALKLITSFGVGYDTLDLDAAHARGIAVTNTPKVLDACVADTALALLLAAARRICQADRFVRAGRWPHDRFIYGTALGGKTCGILGMGAIGLAIAQRAQAFGMRIAYCNRHHRADVEFDYFSNPAALAAAADFLVVALPGGAATQHIVSRAVMEALGPQGILINVGRGATVDEQALVALLSAGKLGGAGLDVYEDEPNVPPALWEMDQVVLTPHIGSATFETRQAMGDLVLANVRAHFAGEPLLTPL